MKKNFLIVSLSAAILFSCDRDVEQVVGSSDLPQTAQTFIQTHFPDATITRVIRDMGRKNTDYEVWLDNNFNLDFDEIGIWTEVDGSSLQIPDSVVPESLLNYVSSNHAEQFITGINRDRFGYEIELSNFQELLFDNNGNFLRMDYDD